MDVGTNLSGRLRNTSLPVSHGLLPVLEAVVNSIHAIEERQLSAEPGFIEISIQRAPAQVSLFPEEEQGKKGRPSLGEIEGFTVLDNGIGFNEANFRSFLTLDSEHKSEKGGRGIGRLLWLKAFNRAEIKSVYAGEGDRLVTRSFKFSRLGVEQEPLEFSWPGSRNTRIRLVGFEQRYRNQTKKTGQAIAQAILEHCLWYFLRPGGAPRISLIDDERIDFDELFEAHMHSKAARETVQIKGVDFDLLHVRLRFRRESAHTVAYCADNRVVAEVKLSGVVPGLHGALLDESGEFHYACYVSSDFLDQSVRPERNAFDISADTSGLFEEDEIGWRDIEAEVRRRAEVHLSEHLEDVKKRARERVHKFISNKAPRYRPVENRIVSANPSIDPEISDRELELVLHKHFADFERQLLIDGHNLMVPRSDEAPEEYYNRVRNYLSAAEEVKKSDLVGYVAHRRVVLDLLETAIQRRDDGRYQREDLIHSLIMPMRKDSTELMLDSCNLWLLDERLAFHDYLASDKTIRSMPITGAADLKEPDLCGLNVFDNPILVSEGSLGPLAAFVVVEIKRPMRNDAAPGGDKDPIEQVLSYLDRIRMGGVLTATGRPIPASNDIPGFCYVVCDLTPSMIGRCRMHDLTRTSDGMGYFAYKKNYGAYVEVTSFDRLVDLAKQRNRAFFDKLGLPTS